MRPRRGGARALAVQALACAAAGALSGLPASPEAPKPRIAIVIDDFGLTYPKNVPDEKWMEIRWPVSFAVMPESPRTALAARETLKAGHELIIHFPFDPFLSLELPKDRVSPADMEKVERLLEKSLRQIPGAVGLNNHRGYLATKNRPLMAAFMERLKARKVYFLDSKVSAHSVAFEEARRAGIPAAASAVFLDEAKVHDKAFCARMLRRAAARARQEGQAVAIGHHYFHGTYEGLIEEVPKLKAEGFEFVRASALVR